MSGSSALTCTSSSAPRCSVRVARSMRATPLRLAVDLAHRCGATALEELALAELRATGARPRRHLTTGPGALASRERRVAALAAGERQNREIAEALVVTLATVEYHLRNAYRKLGIASRTELSEALGAARAKLNLRVLEGAVAVLQAVSRSSSCSTTLSGRRVRSCSHPTRKSEMR
jgi:DNA-binding CsgD family transcriptional regulator